MRDTLYIDLETVPGPEETRDEIEVTHPGNIKKQETIDNWYAEKAPALIDEKYRKQSFNGGEGNICHISWAVGDEPVAGLSLGPNRSDEKNMLVEAMLQIHIGLQGKLASPIVCGHNVVGFDIRFLAHRLLVNDIRVPHWLLVALKAKPWDDTVADTMLIWAGARSTVSMANMSKYLGLEGKTEGMDGSKVYDAWLAGKHKEIGEYCDDDVALVRKIHLKLKEGGLC